MHEFKNLLKPSQNKKDRKFFRLHQKWSLFLSSHHFWCYQKNFWPFLFCNSFTVLTFYTCAMKIKSQNWRQLTINLAHRIQQPITKLEIEVLKVLFVLIFLHISLQKMWLDKKSWKFPIRGIGNWLLDPMDWINEQGISRKWAQLCLQSVNFKMSFWCLQISQKTNEIFSRIFALASKKRSNQKRSVKESK